MTNVGSENEILADLINPYAHQTDTGQRLNNIIKRRRSILAETRKLVSEVGLEELKISHVAARCGTTTQTVYNNFGPKSDLAAKALTDYVDTVHDLSLSLSQGVDFFLHYHRLYFISCCRYPEFMREFMFSAMNKKNAMVFKMSSHGKVFKVRVLDDLEHHGLIRKFVDKRRFIDHFSRATAFNLFAWACHGDYADFLDKLMTETVSLLSDILTDDALQDVQLWLTDYLPDLRNAVAISSSALRQDA